MNALRAALIRALLTAGDGLMRAAWFLDPEDVDPFLPVPRCECPVCGAVALVWEFRVVREGEGTS